MTGFIELIRSFFIGVFDELGQVMLPIGPYIVPLSGVLVAFLIISIVITVFWKGGGA